MGYKLLGFAVWRGAKWYLARRVGPHPRRKAAVAGGVLALSAAAVALAFKNRSRG
jgi:hypothetical protein